MSGTAGALAAEANTIFDILNLSFGARPNPETSHRYYLCRESTSGNPMSPTTCEQVNYARVQEFFHKKETIPTTDVMIPVERTTPRPLDQAVLSYKLWMPVVILPSK